MAIPAQYQEISVEGLPALSERMQTEGHRFVQVLAVNTEAGIDVQYTFMKDGVLEVFTIKGVTPEIPIPSITDRFIAAFVFENETHDLFGMDVQGIAIDFGGNFYALAQKEPMTIISPEQKAAREKAAKEQGAYADAAKAAPDADGLEAKLAGMDPEKAAKVRAAMEAKAKKEAAAKQAAADEKIAGLDPEKAAKVKAALAAKAAREAGAQAQAEDPAPAKAKKEGE